MYSTDCDLSAIPLDVIMRDLITVDADGRKGFRVMYIEACEEQGVSCDTPLSPEQVFRETLGVNDCNKLAIRLALPATS